MSENDRQQRLIERVQEDERLRGDLTDEAATALVEWASRHVAAAADDPARPDADVEAEVQAIRAAARAAARAGEADPPRVIVIAEATLARQAQAADQSQARTDAAGASATPALLAAEQTQPPPPKTDAPPPLAPAQPGVADPPERARISFWRRWSPFANIWDRFRGDR